MARSLRQLEREVSLMLQQHDPNIYLREGGGDRVKPQHLVVVFAFLVVLYVAGSAALRLLGRL